MKHSALWVALVVWMLVAGCGIPPAGIVTPAPLPLTKSPEIETMSGNLSEQVLRLERLMPRARSGGFIPPTDAEKKSFAVMVDSLSNDNLTAALAAAIGSGFELLWFSDTGDSDSISYVLRELAPSKKGWGLYVFRLSPTSNYIIEVPHPLADENTSIVGVDLYRTINARALLVAGAHRDANRDGTADASHNVQTIFQAVHVAELQSSLDAQGSAVILQVHGFASSKHPNYPQIVLSFDTGSNSNPVDLLRGKLLVKKLADALSARGISVGVCNGDEWTDLCGETSVQSRLMSQGIFIHIELNEAIRKTDKMFLAAVAQALGPEQGRAIR